MKRILLPLVLVLAIAPTANAVLVKLSLDGVNPAPEAIDVTPAEIIAMYVISDSDGVGYLRVLETVKDNPLTISNVESYPATGRRNIPVGDLEFELVFEDGFEIVNIVEIVD